MKKVIKLTETDLHNIIKEAINELDWRTYASAYDKDKNHVRREKFKDASIKSFDKQYNQNLKDNEKITGEGWEGYMKNYPDYISYDVYATDKDKSRLKDPSDNRIHSQEFCNCNGVDNYIQTFPKDPNATSEKGTNQFHKAIDDVQNWKRGNSQYKNGKWS